MRMEKLRAANPLQADFDDFYNLFMDTFDTVCQRRIKLGGQYLSVCHARDGHKYVCMDELVEDLQNGDCLVYSFGLASDWTFEENLAAMGCKVYAFDPTVDGPAKLDPNIHFEKIGIIAASDGRTNYQTLDSLLAANGHSATKISYMKFDVEGAEIAAIPMWIKSGVLTHVRQLALEIHLGNGIDSMRNFFKTFKDLQITNQFRIFSWDPNTCWKNSDTGKFYRLSEIVFHKIDPKDSCSQ